MWGSSFSEQQQALGFFVGCWGGFPVANIAIAKFSQSWDMVKSACCLSFFPQPAFLILHGWEFAALKLCFAASYSLLDFGFFLPTNNHSYFIFLTTQLSGFCIMGMPVFVRLHSHVPDCTTWYARDV